LEETNEIGARSADANPGRLPESPGSPATAGTAGPTTLPAPSLVLVGTSFKSAPLAFRERAARQLSGTQGGMLLASISGVDESSIIETCNRVEVYMTATDPSAAAGSLITKLGGGPEGFYVKTDLAAISHIFRVASGLDSVVIGEDQILQQVKDAGRRARVAGRARSTISSLFDAAHGVGGRVRMTYEVPPSQRSLSAFALTHALRELGSSPKSVLLIGTGETAKLAALQLEGAKIYVLSRRKDVGEKFAAATRIKSKEIAKTAAECDLIVSATRRSGYTIRAKDVPDDRRRIVLDLAFPRNVDPRLKSCRFVKLYDLDDLAKAVGHSPKVGPLAATEDLIAMEAEKYNRWLVATRLTPTLAGIYRWAEAIREDEVDLALRRLSGLSEKERKVVEVMSRRLVSKLMAPHASFAKQRGTELEQPERLRLLKSIFGDDSA
jgi:glutamyl-tRNA reductase